MAARSHYDIARRLIANVEENHPDQADAPMKVPAAIYRDPQRWHAEMDKVFHHVPLVVAMSCDLPTPGDYNALEIAGRPVLVVRGDDGVARTFLNLCRHRGALVATEHCGQTRRFTCPYHAWTYDTSGRLVGVTGRETFGEVDVTGLIELPTDERVGMVFAVLTPGADIDVDEWLGGMGDALADMQLDKMHRYSVLTELEGPNWKIAADGYVDGYHIGYLHRQSIGQYSITNRNTYDLFGPHVRVGFATKMTPELRDLPEEEWDLNLGMSLVHFVFPNVSLAGGLGESLMFSRLLPGPTPERSRTVQYHYYREPLETVEQLEKAEERRLLFERVVRDEDYTTGAGITRNLGAFGDDHFRFGRNEPGNQLFHRTLDTMVGTLLRPTLSGCRSPR